MDARRLNAWLKIEPHTPLIPAQAKIQQQSLVMLLQLSLARNYPLSSPRRRGPIATELSISRRPHHIATTRRMGPRLRGDDNGRFIASHIRKRESSLRVHVALGLRFCGDERESASQIRLKSYGPSDRPRS